MLNILLIIIVVVYLTLGTVAAAVAYATTSLDEDHCEHESRLEQLWALSLIVTWPYYAWNLWKGLE